MAITLVVAVARNGIIGKDGGLPWRIPGELARFKALTTGHPVIMGRKTYQSIGKPLPGRTNIVVSRNRALAFDGAEVVTSLDDALALAAFGRGGDDAMVIGGAEIYALTLPDATRLVLTEVAAEIDGDTYFPDFDRREWRETARESVETDGADVPNYSVVTLQRNGA
jgi:dihydrofolate reductase